MMAQSYQPIYPTPLYSDVPVPFITFSTSAVYGKPPSTTAQSQRDRSTLSAECVFGEQDPDGGDATLPIKSGFKAT